MSKEDLINAALKAVVEGDDDAAEDVANKVIAEGLDPLEMISEGLAKGMIKVGDLFAKEEYALPQVLLSGDHAAVRGWRLERSRERERTVEGG